MNEPHDPYTAPQAQIRAERAAQLVVASRIQRLVNYLIDSTACVALIFCGLSVYSAIDPGVIETLKQPNPWRDLLMTALVLLVYYVPMEGMFGVTLGKLVTNTRVVDEQGRPPSWGQVLARTVARLIPFEQFTILFSPADRPTAWHDRLPKTLVVRAQPALASR